MSDDQIGLEKALEAMMDDPSYVKTGYLAKKKEYEENFPEEDQIVVTRTAGHILAPSKELLEDWKNNKIDWEEYNERYLKEILNDPEKISKVKELAKRFRDGDKIRLICYEKDPSHCHRSILQRLIKKYKKKIEEDE